MREGTNARYLFAHRFLFRLALAAGNVFAWVIVFRMFFLALGSIETALAGTAALYILSQVVTFVLTPLAGMALRRGIRRALILGTLAAVGSYGFFATIFLAQPDDRVFWIIATFAITMGIHRALYWIPYKAAEAAIAERSPRALAREALVALVPAGAGYMLATLENGLLVLFSSASVLMLLSALLLARVPEKYESFDWTYRETIRELTARGNHLAVGLFILDGVQGATLLLIWPLAAFLVLGQSFQLLGAVLTATFCIAFLGRYVTRYLLRRLGVARSPGVLATIVFSSWIFRLAAGSPVQLLAVDIFYNSGASPRRFSIDTYGFEQAADGGHFVDEYTAVKEMGLAIGRIAVCTLFIVLLTTTAESLAFAAAIFTAAIAAAWSVFLGHRLQKVVY